MKRTLIIAAFFVLLLELASCNNIPGIQFPENSLPPTLIETVPVEATTSPVMNSPTGEQSLMPSEAVAASASSEVIQPPLVEMTPTPTVPCNFAAAGRPIDVTIPDDAEIPAGTSFTKVWRLVNSGSCTWTQDYEVVWFSGDPMGPVTAQNLSREVVSGQSIDIAVDLIAPDEIGTRQSFWKLRDADADLFGIGPAGNAPFWVRITVDEPASTEPTALPAPTPTSTTLIQGAFDLLPGESLNLDTGEKVAPDQGDLLLEDSSGQLLLQPTSGAVIGIAGSTDPSQVECRLTAQGTEPLIVTEVAPGTYLCYQTDQGLPGIARLMDFSESGIRLDFLTWAIP